MCIQEQYMLHMDIIFFFFFSSRRRHTRCSGVSWARRCVQETGVNGQVDHIIDEMLYVHMELSNGRTCGMWRENDSESIAPFGRYTSLSQDGSSVGQHSPETSSQRESDLETQVDVELSLIHI
eukprot:TRINITY_DN1924_c0_g1_i1.p2 TRINITY_DN1924_c0_g1~~TRINITY_DN1924_c0_g1_i1.p2  ORF type:complete len:123 (+),score=41.25 TRINITY_DN1924_c0_g1_i1:2-370(+)